MTTNNTTAYILYIPVVKKQWKDKELHHIPRSQFFKLDDLELKYFYISDYRTLYHMSTFMLIHQKSEGKKFKTEPGGKLVVRSVIILTNKGTATANKRKTFM